MFFIIEINIRFSTNNSFLKNNILVDIPGLDDSNENYINTIFDIIKEKVKFGILLFNPHNLELKDTFEIMEESLDKRKCNKRF